MKKRIVSVILALLLLCVPSAALADEAYDVLSHDVHITVSEDRQMEVVERMVLDYQYERHGFYYQNLIGGTATYEAEGEVRTVKFKHRISDFNVQGVPFETSTRRYGSDTYFEAKIGDPNKTIIGEQEYVISYRTFIGYEAEDKFDAFYRNLLFCETGETIEDVNFIIEMPKDFDENKVDFMLGGYGTAYEDGIEWEKDGNTIRGHLTRPMTGGEYLTVRIMLPNGYFGQISDESWNDITKILVWALMFIV